MVAHLPIIAPDLGDADRREDGKVRKPSTWNVNLSRKVRRRGDCQINLVLSAHQRRVLNVKTGIWLEIGR
jgi:hypothetical protein